MAVKKYLLRDLGDDLPSMLSWNEAFISAGISAHGTFSCATVKGMLSDEMHEKYCTSTYAVYSYDTAIAWEVLGTWYVNSDYYSRTTSYHQNLIRAALTAAHIEFIVL